MHKGQLKSWNGNKGFGFIQSDDLSQNTFIHISALKAMSRKPKIGDFIYFEVEKQADGKTKAINCRIEGVAPKSTNQNKSIHRLAKKNKAPKSKLVLVLLVLAIGAFTYQRLDRISAPKQPSNTPTNITPSIITNPIQATPQFKCDGRQHCSQMKSRAEAVFFIQHCPNTKMDGDNDGIPCENDSRF